MCLSLLLTNSLVATQDLAHHAEEHSQEAFSPRAWWVVGTGGVVLLVVPTWFSDKLPGVFLSLGTDRGVAAWFHAGEDFHPEKLWDLLLTAGLVALGLAAVIGFLWALRRWQERHNQIERG